MTEAEAKAVTMLEKALAILKAEAPERADAIGNVAEAIRALRHRQVGIRPENLSSANDG